MTHPTSRRRSLLLPAMLALSALAGLVRPAAAQQYVLTVGGTFDAAHSSEDAYAYDGTTFTDLTPVLGLSTLGGSTFTATLTFPALTPPTNPAFNTATYPLTPASSIQFTIYDAAGHVLHQSSGLGSSAFATVDRHVPVTGPSGPAGYFDGVHFVSQGSGVRVSGTTPFAPLYGPQVEFDTLFDLNFNNFGDLAHPYLSGLGIPTDAATYLSLPNRTFRADLLWGDGDFVDQSDVFQYDEAQAVYSVTRVTVAAVPEPSPAALLAVGLLGVTALILRARRRARTAAR